MANELRIVAPTGNTVYAHILDSAARRWNGSSFAVYASASYSAYTVTMTEQGSSGVYVGDFPTGITDSVVYEAVCYLQDGASPAEGDRVAGTFLVDRSGATAVAGAETVSGELDGSDWAAYVLRTFKRTDKNTELYDATNEAIAEIRRKFRTSREEEERTITDAITTLGEYKMDLETDFGLLLSDVFIRDESEGEYLTPISKAMFDWLYTRWGTGASERDRPVHYCLFGGQVLVGPVPDSVDYNYVLTYSKDDHVLVTSASNSVPFTTTDYREILKHGVLYRLYSLVENDDQAGKYKGFWDSGLEQIETKERRNRREIVAVQYRDL